jgi:hypothetical protein
MGVTAVDYTGRWWVIGIGNNFVRLLGIAPILRVISTDLSLRVVWNRVGGGRVVI